MHWEPASMCVFEHRVALDAPHSYSRFSSLVQGAPDASPQVSEPFLVASRSVSFRAQSLAQNLRVGPELQFANCRLQRVRESRDLASVVDLPWPRRRASGLSSTFPSTRASLHRHPAPSASSAPSAIRAFASTSIVRNGKVLSICWRQLAPFEDICTTSRAVGGELRLARGRACPALRRYTSLPDCRASF